MFPLSHLPAFHRGRGILQKRFGSLRQRIARREAGERGHAHFQKPLGCVSIDRDRKALNTIVRSELESQRFIVK